MNHAFLLGTRFGELGKTRLWNMVPAVGLENKFLPFCPAEYNHRHLRVRRNRGILHPISWSANAISTVWQPKFTDTLPPFFSAPQEQVKKSSGILHRNKCPATLALCSGVHDGWKEKRANLGFAHSGSRRRPQVVGVVPQSSRCRAEAGVDVDPECSCWIEGRECVDGLLTRS